MICTKNTLYDRTIYEKHFRLNQRARLSPKMKITLHKRRPFVKFTIVV